MLIPVLFAEYDLNQIHDIGFADDRVFVKAKPKQGMSLAECAYKALRGRRGEPLTAFGGYTPRGKGLITPAFSFGAQVAEVTVDAQTGQVEVDRIYTAHDCGVPINEMAVEGQLEGSIHMGLGYALSEELVTRDGVTRNTSFLDYKLRAAEEMPVSESVAVDTYEPDGPFGAKEAGEGLVSPTAPAVAEAIYQATGYRCRDLPITPIKIWRALSGQGDPDPGRTPGRGC
jgi:4-hydroxybenzoyl-CoA reductase subunit alpha